MNRYRITYRQAWRSDDGSDVTPEPEVIEADSFAEGEYGITFYRRNPDLRPSEADEMIRWMPIDVVRSIELLGDGDE